MAAGQEIIGLTGGMCSGKDSWADFFEEQFGFAHRSTSNIARAYIREHDLGEPTRDLTREVATQLRAEHGTDYLVRRALDDVADRERVVISGLYVVPEALHLKKVGGSLINIAAADDLRFGRMSNRGRAGEAADPNEFRRLMDNDLKATDTDQRLADVIDLADYEIDGSVPIRETARCRAMAVEVLELIRKYKEQ